MQNKEYKIQEYKNLKEKYKYKNNNNLIKKFKTV